MAPMRAILVGVLLLAVVVGCASPPPATPTPAPTPTIVPSTATPLPPTSTPANDTERLHRLAVGLFRDRYRSSELQVIDFRALFQQSARNEATVTAALRTTGASQTVAVVSVSVTGSNYGVVTTSMSDLRLLAPSIFATLPSVDGLDFQEYDPLIDTSGSATSSVAMEFTIERRFAGTVHWPGANLHTLSVLLDSGGLNDAVVAPSLAPAWRQFVAGG